MSKDNVKRRANKALDKINKMRREWRSWQGKEPEILRVNSGDYLALIELGYVRDGKLSGTIIEVKPG